MSKYELSDALVANVVGKAELGQVEAHLIAALISDLKPQIPILSPTGLGAVVRTDRGVLVRVSRDNDRVCEWWLIGEGESKDDQAEQWVEGPKIGRIVEVLSEGVDL